MRSAIRLSTVLMMALMPTTGVTQGYDGLYMPMYAPTGSWRCDADFLGSDGGALGLINGALYGVENTCALTNPKLENGGTRYNAACEAEGEETRSSILIRRTSDGISLERQGEVIQWRKCVTSNAKASNDRWVSGFAMGVSEASTRDANGNSVIFSCNGGYDGRLFIDLGGVAIPGGPVKIDVDGEAYSMTARVEGTINSECSVCAENYISLWQAVAAGNRMSVTAGGKTAQFDLVGSSAALGPIPCVPVGHSN